MEKMLEKLATILQSEADLHMRLITSSKEINAALRKGEIETVDRQRFVHDEVLCHIERLENERIKYCLTVAESLGIVKSQIRLTMVLDKIPEEWKRRLGELQCILKDRINELAKINLSNRILLQEGLKMIENTFLLFHRAVNRYAAYGNLGQTTVSSAPRSIINRIV